MSRTAWFRILGRQDIIWSTRSLLSGLPDGAATGLPLLLSIPDALRCAMSPLDPIAADSGIEVRLAVSDAYTAPLLYASRATAGTDGQIERLTRGLSSTATRLYTSQQTRGVDDVIWIDREAMIITVVEVDGYTVERAQFGSVAVAHPMQQRASVSDVAIGPRLYVDYTPDPVGQWCELGYSDGTTSTTVWRGVVERIGSASGREIVVTAVSLLAALRARGITEAQAWADGTLGTLTYDGPGSARWGHDVRMYSVERSISGPDTLGISTGGYDDGDGVTRPIAWWDLDAYPDVPDLDIYVRLTHPDGRYVVLPAEYALDETAAYYSTDTPMRLRGYALPQRVTWDLVAQMGDATGAIPLTQSPDNRRHIAEVLGTTTGQLVITRARTASGWDGVIVDLLTERGDLAWGGGLPDAWVGGASTGLANLDPASHTSEPSQPPLWIYPPPREDARMLDYLSDTTLRLIGAGITHDEGMVQIVDWGPSSDTATGAIDDVTAREPRDYTWRRDAYHGASIARLAYRATTQIVATDRAGGSLIGTAVRDVSASWVRDVPTTISRWQALTYRYGAALPTVELTVDAAVGTVGDTVTLTRPDLPQRGAGAPADDEGVIIERTLSLRTGTARITVLVTTWIEDAQPTRWGPVGTIASVSALGGDDYACTIDAGEAAPWALVDLPESVALCDSTGATLDEPCTLTLVSGTVLTITTNGATPAAGDLLVLAEYAQITGAPNLARWGWLADTDGTPSGYVWAP